MLQADGFVEVRNKGGRHWCLPFDMIRDVHLWEDGRMFVLAKTPFFAGVCDPNMRGYDDLERALAEVGVYR